MTLLAQFVAAFDGASRAQFVAAWRPDVIAIPSITATRAEVIDLDANQVLYSKGSGSAVPASLTKMMTAHVLTQQRTTREALSEVATFTTEDSADAGTYNLVVGDQLSLYSLLGNMLLPSDNASASAIARVIGLSLLGGVGTDAEARARFVAEMNTQAAALGMASTSFVNPHGVGTVNQSAPADMNKLAASLAKNRIVREVWRYTLFRFPVVRGGSTVTLTAASSNDLDGRVGIIGGKTGTVGAAINLTVLWEAPNGHLLASSVFGSSSDANRFSDTTALLSAAVIDYPSLATPGTPFTPAHLFDTLGLDGAWYDATDTAHMWQDDAGTAPVSEAGQPVGKWSPRAGLSGAYWRQTTASKRPTMGASGVVFDGSDDFLDLGAPELGNTGLFADAASRFMVAQRASVSSGSAETLLAKAGSATAARTLQSYVSASGSGDAYLYVRGSLNGVDTDNLGTGSIAVNFWWDGQDGAHARGQVGSRHLIVGTASDESTQNINLGGRTGGTADFLNGSIEQIVVVDSYDIDVFRRLRDWSNGAAINAYPSSASLISESAVADGGIGTGVGSGSGGDAAGQIAAVASGGTGTGVGSGSGGDATGEISATASGGTGTGVGSGSGGDATGEVGGSATASGGTGTGIGSGSGGDASGEVSATASGGTGTGVGSGSGGDAVGEIAGSVTVAGGSGIGTGSGSGGDASGIVSVVVPGGTGTGIGSGSGGSVVDPFAVVCIELATNVKRLWPLATSARRVTSLSTGVRHVG